MNSSKKSVFRAIVAMLVATAVIFSAGSAPAQTSDAKILKALKYLDLGNAPQALTEFQQMVAQSPKNAEAHAGLALAMIETGDINGAEKEVALAYDIEHKNILVRIARGTFFGKKGKREDAVEEFNKAIKINDKEIATFLAFAHYYLSIDSLKSAEITLYRAQSVNATDVRPFFGLAELYEKQHIPDLAIEQYQEAKKIESTNPIIFAKLAQLYFRGRKYNESLKEWDNLTKLDSTYGRAYYEMAHIYDLTDDHLDAAKYAEKFVALNPDNTDGVWLLARSLSESNQFTKAIPYLEKSAKNDSLKNFTNLYLARSYFFAKQYAKANELFAISKNLGVYDLYYAGWSIFSMNDTSKAIEFWKKSLASDTDHKAQEKLKIREQIIGILNVQKKFSEIAQVYLDVAKDKNSASDYTSAGQFFTFANLPQDAINAFHNALQINPKYLMAYVGIADALEKTPEGFSEAWKMLDTAMPYATTVEEKDNLGSAYVRLAIQFYVAKDYTNTASIVDEKALKLLSSKSPYLLNAYNILGTAYVQLKDCKKATEAYKEVLKIKPDDENAKKGLEYLKQVCK
ncbi:MAG: tetratricopeptide repeat protein [bacterium]